MAVPPFDIAALRAKIPILERAIPLNNCSQAPLTSVTRDAAARYMESWNSRGMDWDEWMGEVELARRAFAAMINAEPDEVSVVSSVSAATSAIATAIDFGSGRDVVVASGAEFPAVGHVWKAQERRGARVRWVALRDGHVPLEMYEGAIDERTAIVSAAHAYYQNGAVQDVAAIARLARSHGALSYVDAYQSLGVLPVDVRAMDLDLLASGTLKYLMGTPGIAFLYVRRALVARLEPLTTGWFGRVNPFAFDATRLDWSASASRFDGGTPPIFSAYVSRAAMEWLHGIGSGAIAEWTQHLSTRLVEGALARGLALHGPGLAVPKTPSTAILCEDAHAVESALRTRGIIASARGPVIRLAPHFYNTVAEIDHALDALVEVLAEARTPVTEVREHFASRLGTILTMVGVAVGLGNIWRFPYLVGRYGGAAFVAFYVLVALVIGVPALLAEWTLGRHTGRGTLGAFQRGRLPGGRFVGGALFCVVVAATAYYTNVVGWVLYFALSELLSSIGIALDASAILPPETGVSGRSILLQVACTGVVIASCAFVIDRGLRAGIERASTVIMPTLFVILVVLIVRSLTLPGADEGVRWFIGRFAWRDLTPTVMVAAMGQAIFSLSLGGTFMVTYGSYLPAGTPLRTSAAWTALGDTTAGLMAGLVIFPAVFAFGLSPSSGPGLLFDTLPRVFGQMPGGGLFGALFFVGLFGAAFLSDVAALEVLIAGVVDNTALTRRKAISLMAAIVGLVALVPMINLKIFVAWDLTFGSGMQALGALLSVLTMGWFVQRATLLEQLGDPGPARRILVTCIRYVIPAAMLTVGLWWLLTDLLHLIPTV